MTAVRPLVGHRPRLRPVSASLTPDQITRRRHEDWLHDYEVGRLDPASGRIERRPIDLIARLAGVSERTVRRGIAEARSLRRLIHERLEAEADS